jgi:hypothetical protein
MGQFEIGVITEIAGAGLAIYGFVRQDAYAIGVGVALGYIGNNLAKHELEANRTNNLAKSEANKTNLEKRISELEKRMKVD